MFNIMGVLITGTCTSLLDICTGAGHCSVMQSFALIRVCSYTLCFSFTLVLPSVCSSPPDPLIGVV